MQIILSYLNIVSPNFAKELDEYLNKMNEDDFNFFVNSILGDGRIYTSLKPISESLTIDDLISLHEEFPYIQQIEMNVPIEDSNGNTRFVPARRTVVAAPIYMYRLKQYAEEKFSVTSLSATNIKNENTRSKASKNHTALHTNTPVKFGEMETGNLSHAGMDVVVSILMTHSVSPHARRLVEKLLIDDPYNIDIKPDETASNRNVEILNAYLKTMGLRLVFKKKFKNNKKVVSFNVVSIQQPSKQKVVSFINPNEKVDLDEYYRRQDEIEEKKKRSVVTTKVVTMHKQNNKEEEDKA